MNNLNDYNCTSREAAPYHARWGALSASRRRRGHDRGHWHHDTKAGSRNRCHFDHFAPYGKLLWPNLPVGCSCIDDTVRAADEQARRLGQRSPDDCARSVTEVAKTCQNP